MTIRIGRVEYAGWLIVTLFWLLVVNALTSKSLRIPSSDYSELQNFLLAGALGFIPTMWFPLWRLNSFGVGWRLKGVYFLLHFSWSFTLPLFVALYTIAESGRPLSPAVEFVNNSLAFYGFLHFYVLLPLWLIAQFILLAKPMLASDKPLNQQGRRRFTGERIRQLGLVALLLAVMILLLV